MAYLAEDEAKTKWCHRTGTFDAAGNCIASGCMAWRWEENPRHVMSATEAHARAEEFTSLKDLRNGWAEIQWKHAKGFCGLAGRVR